jgi:hypothetical protein
MAMLTLYVARPQMAYFRSAGLLGLVSIAFVLGSIDSVMAQPKTGVPLAGDDRIIAAADGWPLHITYYKSDAGKDAAVIVLLHGKSSNKLVWGGQSAGGGFVKRLHDLKYAVITVDLRKHGQSMGKELLDEDADVKKKKKSKKKKVKGSATRLKSIDYQLMVRGDLEGVKQFIYAEHQKQNLNMRKLAIIAPEMSAALALQFTLFDWGKRPFDDAPVNANKTPRGQDVQSLILISPSTTVPGVPIGRGAIKMLKSLPISYLVCVGKTDKLDKRQATQLFSQLGGKNEKRKGMYYQEYATNFRGTDLFAKKLKIEVHILGFLDKHLQKLDVAWRTRKSRLQR